MAFEVYIQKCIWELFIVMSDENVRHSSELPSAARNEVGYRDINLNIITWTFVTMLFLSCKLC